jgi:hypothetical protein
LQQFPALAFDLGIFRYILRTWVDEFLRHPRHSGCAPPPRIVPLAIRVDDRAAIERAVMDVIGGVFGPRARYESKKKYASKEKKVLN